MKLCMFSPRGQELDRGWPGRIEGDTVVQLATQTLAAYFTGGGEARSHATYPLAEVVFRAPVLRPPSIRIFGADGDFVFANPAAVHGPDEPVALPDGVESIEAQLRLAAVIGDGRTIGGFTLMSDFRAPQLRGTKAHDFAIALGPLLVTPDEIETAGDWDPLVEHVGRNTRLYPGDILAAGGELLGPFHSGDTVEVGFEPIGTLRNDVV
jgi:hypothetical protein